MSYESYRHNHRDRRDRPPFSGWILPMGAAGEAVYAAFEAVARVIRRVHQGTVARHREDAVANMLRSLDDRTLADIGVRRPDIRSVAQQVVDPARHGHPAARR